MAEITCHGCGGVLAWVGEDYNFSGGLGYDIVRCSACGALGTALRLIRSEILALGYPPGDRFCGAPSIEDIARHTVLYVPGYVIQGLRDFASEIVIPTDDDFDQAIRRGDELTLIITTN